MNTISTKSTACSSTPFNFYRTIWRRMSHVFFSCSIVIWFLSSAVMTTFWVTSVEASSHYVNVLEIPIAAESIPKILRFPLYEQESIQYFSAGIGKEERSLTYPPLSNRPPTPP